MTLAISTIRHLSPAARKADRERDQAAALREYTAESAAVQAKTARLRELRPAKQASDAQKAIAPKKKRAAAPRRSGVRPMADSASQDPPTLAQRS